MTTSPNTSERSTQAYVVMALVVALYAAVFWRVFGKLGSMWSNDSNYSHGFLVPVVSGYLTWEKRKELAALPLVPERGGALVLLAGVALLLLGTLGAELFLQNVSTVVVLVGLVWLLCGWVITRVVLFPLLFLCFYVPIPAIVLNQVAFPLQLLAARAATATLTAFEVPVLREGNIIELAGTTLEVAEACSGIRSLQALVALSAVYAYVMQSLWWKRALLVLLSLPTAVASNAFRVSGTGLIAHYLGVEKAEGFYHGFAGWLIFIVAFALLALFNALLDRAGSIVGPATQPTVAHPAKTNETASAIENEAQNEDKPEGGS